MGDVGFSWSIVEVLVASFTVTVQPVVEGSSGDLCAGADLAD